MSKFRQIHTRLPGIFTSPGGQTGVVVCIVDSKVVPDVDLVVDAVVEPVEEPVVDSVVDGVVD